MAYEKGAIVQGTIVEMQQPAIARVVSTGGMGMEPLLGTEYPSLIEMTNKFESDLGMSGTTVEVVEAACKELGVNTAGLSLVQKAERAWDIMYSGHNRQSAGTPVGAPVMTAQPGAVASGRPAVDGAPRLILVPAESGGALRLDHAATLRSGGAAPLTANNGEVNIGLYWEHPRNAWGHWDYIDLGVSPEVQPLTVRLDGPYLAWQGPHGEMVFDVSMWQLRPGNHLVAVKACPGNPGGPTRMSKDAAGRDFVLNTDGTISMRTAPQLRLGVAPSDGSSPDFPGKIVAQQMQGCWMCFCWPGGWALFSKTAQGPDHIVHSGMVCLMFTIPLPFTEPRKRVPYTNGFNKADGSEPHNIDTYVSPGCVKNGPSCSCRICPG